VTVKKSVHSLRTDMGLVVESTLRSKVQNMYGQEYGKSFCIRSLYDVGSYFDPSAEGTVSKTIILKDILSDSFEEFSEWAKNEGKIIKPIDKFSTCSGAGLQVLSWKALGEKNFFTELEIDCRGKHSIYNDIATIEIAEIKSNVLQIPKAIDQLQRNLIILCAAMKLLFAIKKVIMIGRVFYSLGKKVEEDIHEQVNEDHLSISVYRM